MIEIKDDVSPIEPALRKTQRAFKSFKTRPVSFRVAQLKAFLKGAKEMEKEMGQALQADLGRATFTSWLIEFKLLQSDIEHCLDHIH